jgi:methyl-accepting chemotaxis protein
VTTHRIDEIETLKEMLKEPNRFTKQIAETIIKWVEFSNKLAWRIEDLQKTIEQQKKEYQTLYSSIAESDEMIEQLQHQIKHLETNTHAHSDTVSLKKAPYDDIDDV